jgi:hypothetical protein
VRLKRPALLAIALPLLGLAAFHAAQRPSNERDWSPDQAVLPLATIDGERVTIRNVRNFQYRSETEWVPRYDLRTYELSKLDSAWFGVERFEGHSGVAHTFLSFGFGDEYVAISVEIRKEKGEVYSPLKGLLRRYELMYVIGDERDVIGLRTNYRKDEVCLYPIRTSREKMRRVFVDMLERANDLAAHPEFYNTLTSTCTTNIVRHVNTISPRRVPVSLDVVLPARSDRLAWNLGLLDTDLPLAAARRAFRIDEVARAGGDPGPEFSTLIRSTMPNRD